MLCITCNKIKYFVSKKLNERLKVQDFHKSKTIRLTFLHKIKLDSTLSVNFKAHTPIASR